jgi:hypothetical protein
VTDFSELSFSGRLVTSEDSDWDQARQGQNLIADLRPSAIAFVESADDVSAVVGFAREEGLKVTGQGTGHGAPALPPLEGTILIKTTEMRGTEVDPGTHSARVEAGVRGSELGAAAGEHGLCFLPGSSPTVGLTGYTLGGGLGWLGRRHGFACNRVRAIEVVTADGEQRKVDAENDAELFWALRGGGGGYAIVTALHLDLLEIAEVYAGVVIYPAEVGADAFSAYRDWAADAPDEITASARFLRPPPLPDVPEPLRDRPLITLTAVFIGNKEEGEEAFAPIREIGEPIMDTFDQIPASRLSTINMDPEQPVPGLGHHALIRELPDDAIDAFVGVAGPDAGSPLLMAELRQAGGALGRKPEDAGALERLDAAFVMVGIGVPMNPEAGEAITKGLDRVHETMQPWAAAGGFFNFADRPAPIEAILPEDTCRRLAEVKRQWDPDELIRANHSVSPAPARA